MLQTGTVKAATLELLRALQVEPLFAQRSNIKNNDYK